MGEFGAAATLGVLVGLLVGMSTEKLAGTILAGLIAALSAFLGLQARAGSGGVSLPRLSGFALAGSVALLGGVWLRTHDVLGVDPAARQRRWVAAGLRPEQASQLVVYETTGLNLAGAGAAAGTAVASETPAGRGVLFAASADDCRDLRADRFASAEDRRRAFALVPDWDRVGRALMSAAPDVQTQVMQAVWTLACAPRGHAP